MAYAGLPNAGQRPFGKLKAALSLSKYGTPPIKLTGTMDKKKVPINRYQDPVHNFAMAMATTP